MRGKSGTMRSDPIAGTTNQFGKDDLLGRHQSCLAGTVGILRATSKLRIAADHWC